MSDASTVSDAERKKKDEEKRRRGAIWFWRWFRTPSDLGIASLFGAVVAGTVGWIGIDRYEVWALKREPAAQIEVARDTPNSTVFEINGFDKQGRRGVFDVVVLKKSFQWVHGSDSDLENDGKRIPANAIVQDAFDSEVRGALAEALEIVGVGTASQEGEGTAETARAGRRADRSADIAKTVALGHVPLWTLNLGQYRQPCDACETTGTSWQRPFIVVAVKELQNGADLGEALADAMTNREKLPSPSAYSAFQMSKIRG